MSDEISNLYSRLNEDVVRREMKYSDDIAAAHQKMFSTSDVGAIAGALSEWLNRFQPCLFGRLAAKAGLIHYCLLQERDLLGSDQSIRDKIQFERNIWTRMGFEGHKSGFVVLAVSERLAVAAPDDVLRQFAQRLCSLYLLEDEIRLDEIYADEIFLEKPGARAITWKWLAGVNVFSTSGDKRWWQDHRIPGGLGFSVNSVGHMVKSGLLVKGLRDLDQLLGVASDPLATTKIDSLEKALEFAMRTIWNASEAVSGKATELVPLAEDAQQLVMPKCPVDLPRFLTDKNFCEYVGYYHTDVTLPSSYFMPAVERPPEIKKQELDFTYLFHDHVDNPAFQTMGKGRQIRGEEKTLSYWGQGQPKLPKKIHTARLTELAISAAPRLVAALNAGK